MDDFFNRIGRSPILSPRNFQYACAVSGIFCSLFFFCAFVACDFLPPIPANWTAEQTVQHYKDHKKGIEAGSAMLLISGMLYLPLTAAISGQMRRIPNLHYSVNALQLASGAAGIFTYMMPGMILGVTNYRLDRPVEITQVMNELFWITCLMPWPTFMTQNFAFAYAILIDTRPVPLFPKPVALVNILAPIIFIPGIAMHTVYDGPLAWNGELTFWLAGITFCVQLIFDSLCLMRAISNEKPGGEKIVDNFPTSLDDTVKCEGSPEVSHAGA
ncbi:membrane protein [Ilyonectria robusta]|uniref:uncharacterized protein n=1 Tax=Ilyonectria robusta TaxID=1079257 RepID=UPI001E8E5808|nr:uncharacterized protein BGZ61DRAFT_348857 [Ilyonectria robusta]KAH8714621.1 membrane protein [Ilyonectria robusta]